MLNRCAVAWWSPGGADYIAGDDASQHAATGQQVVLFGTQWCGYCKKTCEYLAAHDIAYADLDIEASGAAEAMFAELGAPGVPVLLIGDRQIRGFDTEQIAAALTALRIQRQARD